MPKIVNLPPMTEDPAADDVLPLHNVSTGDTEKVTIGDITGALNSGWVAVSDTWEYSSWSSTTKIGVLTVPAGATALYSAGMRIRITQSTGGTKYGIIVKVTSTALTVFFGTDYTLNNETVTSPSYSQNKAPLGFPLSPEKWSLRLASANARTISSATFASLTDNLVVPIGAWQLILKATIHRPYAASTSNDFYKVTLSSTTTTETNPDLTMEWNIRFGSAGASSGGGYTGQTDENVLLASETTFTMLGQRVAGANGSVAGGDVPTIIKAVCMYL